MSKKFEYPIFKWRNTAGAQAFSRQYLCALISMIVFCIYLSFISWLFSRHAVSRFAGLDIGYSF
jgi:hypothetical protein